MEHGSFLMRNAVDQIHRRVHVAEASVPDTRLMTVKDDVISFKQDI